MPKSKRSLIASKDDTTKNYLQQQYDQAFFGARVIIISLVMKDVKKQRLLLQSLIKDHLGKRI
jgi:hypothetical protein